MMAGCLAILSVDPAVNVGITLSKL